MSQFGLDRITLEPGNRDGKPCIRGLRITVYDVLDYLASGMRKRRSWRDSRPHITPLFSVIVVSPIVRF